MSEAPDPAEQPHILVVDDDARLRELLRRYLSSNGFIVSTAGNAAEARARLQGMAFDLLVVDIMMPGETGLELTESLSVGAEAAPILLLTARDDPDDRIAGLEAGADDYLAKPFQPRELVLRINSILRRKSAVPAAAPAVLAAAPPVRLGRFVYQPDRDELRAGEDEVIRLTTAEAALMRALAAQPGAVISREELAERCRMDGNMRTVDVQVTRLRRKIEPDPKEPRYLHTVRGEGYVLRSDP